MQYTELSRTEQKIVDTLVEFTFTINGEEVKEQVNISHFNPKDEWDILLWIENRYISEERALIEKPIEIIDETIVETPQVVLDNMW